MKRRILATALTLCLTLSLVPTAAFAVGDKTFDDVNGHWGQASVERWAGYGVLNGDDFGNFNPDKQMTRAEFATMLANMMGYTAKANSSFGDVASDAWYADAILKLAAAGVMLGDNNGNANPNKPISRAEAAVMLCRAFNIQPSNAGLDFADSGDVADWAKGSMAALAEKGMMNGVGNNQLAPLANITRASVARLVDNMVSEYVTESKEITGTVDGIVLVVGNAEVTVKDATLNENLIVAPKAEGAEVTITGNTTASDVYVDAAASVKVDAQASAGEVQLSAPKAAAEVAGKADTVTTTAAATDATVTVAKDATVSKVEVAAPNTGLNVAGKVDNVNVASTATGAEVKTESGATVSNVTTSANDVKVSGNGKVENVTANGGTADVTTPGTKVENKTDSADNVTANGKPVPPSTGGTTTPTTPSGGGSSGGNSPTYDVTITVNKTGEGTVTADTGLQFNLSNEEKGDEGTGKDVTLTLTPTAQTATAMPYVVESLTVKNSAGETVTLKTELTGELTKTCTFTVPKTGGNFTVEAKFYQPITKAAVMHINGSDNGKKIADMEQYGYPENAANEIVNDTKLAETNGGYLFVGAVKANADLKNTALSDLVVKFNGTTQTVKWNGTNTDPFKNWGCVYINGVVDGDSDTNKDTNLNFTGSSANIEVTFKFQGASYTLTNTYTKKGVQASDIHKVTFKYGAETKEYPGVKDETVTVPTLTNTATTYFTKNWTKTGETEAKTLTSTVTIGETDVVYTAESKTVVEQAFTARPTGPETSHDASVVDKADSFDYAKAYEAAGMAVKNGVVTLDAGKLATYIEASKGKTCVTDKHEDNYLHLLGGNSKANTIQYGVAYTRPAGADTATKVTCITAAKWAAGTEEAGEVVLSGSANSHNGTLISYVSVADIDATTKAIAPKPAGEVDADYYLWKNADGKVLAVTHANLSLGEATNMPKTVTFKNGEAVVKTVQVASGGTVTLPPNPTKAGYDFVGWVTGSGSSEASFTATTPVTADTTVNAKWKPVATITALGKDDISKALTGAWGTDLNAEAMAVTLGTFQNDTAAASGPLKAFKYTAFGGEVAKKNAYYVVLRVDKPEDATGIPADKVVVRAGIDQTAEAYKLKIGDFSDNSGKAADIVMLVGIEETGGAKAQEITIWVNWDGMNGAECSGTKYTITLSDDIYGGVATPVTNSGA